MVEDQGSVPVWEEGWDDGKGDGKILCFEEASVGTGLGGNGRLIDMSGWRE